MKSCPTCRGPMRLLFQTDYYCPKDCDRKGDAAAPMLDQWVTVFYAFDSDYEKDVAAGKVPATASGLFYFYSQRFHGQLKTYRVRTCDIVQRCETGPAIAGKPTEKVYVKCGMPLQKWPPPK